MNDCQFFIEPDNSIAFGFTALFFVIAICAVLTLIRLFRSSVFVSLYRSCVKEVKFFSVFGFLAVDFLLGLFFYNCRFVNDVRLKD